MINHARTLLLNTLPAGNYLLRPGSEYVPPAFIPRQQSPLVALARRVLFGSNPDDVYLNYRLRQIMTLLHSTELATHVTAFDPRITYWPPLDTVFFSDIFGITITPAATVTTMPVISGSHVADESAGRALETWQVTVVAPDILEIVRQVQPLTADTVSLVFVDGLSAPVNLYGSGLAVSLTQATVGDSWVITSVGRPTTDLSTILTGAANALGAGGVDALLSGTEEPFLTLQALWHTHPLFSYVYGAFVLGLVHALDTAPQVI